MILSGLRLCCTGRPMFMFSSSQFTYPFSPVSSFTVFTLVGSTCTGLSRFANRSTGEHLANTRHETRTNLALSNFLVLCRYARVGWRRAKRRGSVPTGPQIRIAETSSVTSPYTAARACGRDTDRRPSAKCRTAKTLATPSA